MLTNVHQVRRHTFGDAPTRRSARSRSDVRPARSGRLPVLASGTLENVDGVEDARDYFAARGYEVAVEQRLVHDELMASGAAGRASFYAKGRLYFCVSLWRSGVVVAQDYAIGESEAEALVAARRRYGSQQRWATSSACHRAGDLSDRA